jgi:alcohol dehydrogenase (NADP+)
MKTITFRNGDSMPILGLGTWKSKPGEVKQAVLWALESGYRHLDCAAIYDNEKEVGAALKEAFQQQLVKREDIFITSKLWNNSHRRKDVKPALEKTLKDLKLDYLDLYLIHWPISFKSGVGFAKTREEFYTYSDVPLTQTWAGMEDVHQKGLARHIGVSNMNVEKINQLLESASHAPEMNQIELHPFLPQHRLVDFCKSQNIHLTAYSPLGSGDRSASVKKEDEPNLMGHETVKAIAARYNCTPAQLLIAYSVNRDIVVIPKSVNQDRIKQNLEAAKIKINEDDLAALNQMDTKYRFINGSFFTGPFSPYSLTDLWEND